MEEPSDEGGSDVHQHLHDAASSLGVDGGFAHLDLSGETSLRFIGAAQDRLTRSARDAGLEAGQLPLDVVAFGSYARHEASQESDFDYLVVAHGLSDNPRATRLMLGAADLLRQSSVSEAEQAVLYGQPDAPPRKEIAGPGSTGMFGRVVSAPDLVERIGLEQDTNQSQTIRMLLLEESISLLRTDLHDKLIRTMIRRYLSDYDQPKPGPPRFLLSDILRYWHTVSLDYAAKRYEQVRPEWGLRYLKLILSRKLAYAGTLAALLSCGPGRPADEEYLHEQFTMPPLARLAQLHDRVTGEHRDALRTLLVAADWFNGRLGDGAFRDAMKAVADRDSADPMFQEAVERARSLQSALEVLFYGAPCMSANALRYLAF